LDSDFSSHTSDLTSHDEEPFQKCVKSRGKIIFFALKNETNWKERRVLSRGSGIKESTK